MLYQGKLDTGNAEPEAQNTNGFVWYNNKTETTHHTPFMDSLNSINTLPNSIKAGQIVRYTTVYNRDRDIFGIKRDPQDTSFGKSVGLGDIDGCEAPPLQIGNRLWIDDNKDGIQDPQELPLSGIQVFLYGQAGNLMSMTTTDTKW